MCYLLKDWSIEIIQYHLQCVPFQWQWTNNFLFSIDIEEICTSEELTSSLNTTWFYNNKAMVDLEYLMAWYDSAQPINGFWFSNVLSPTIKWLAHHEASASKSTDRNFHKLQIRTFYMLGEVQFAFFYEVASVSFNYCFIWWLNRSLQSL